ncbi:MAG: VCBS repeat-containing protein [Candidatus Omnitrophica bacterium]|nr:VCBS repeat-containing protein [Candidatus Omnitrophota bacterium]
MIRKFLNLTVCFGVLMVSPVVFAAVGPSANNAFILSENLDVDPSTGTAALTIPIDIPQGRAGIQPNLTLLYNSSGGNGMLGMGWNLELGNIQRSVRKGIPRYTSADTFVITAAGSQQELVDISGNGTEFRPETEAAFSKIKFDGTAWIVTDTKGTKYYFGTSASTRLSDPANASRIYRWDLEKVEDINGNFMTVTYVRSENQLYPSIVNYTGNSKISLPPYAQVRFNYETRTASGDVGTGYISGFKIVMTQRMKSIETYVGTTFQRRYTMTYEQETEMGRSLLKSVGLIGRDGVSTLPPTILTYSQGITGFDAPVSVINAPPYNVGQSRLIRMIDMNGDGKADFVLSANGSYSIYYNQTSGATVAFSAPMVAKNSPSVAFNNENIRVVDLNGDGLMDVVYGPANQYTVWINNGVDGFNPPEIVVNSPNTALSQNYVQFMDMNGDGKMDMLDTNYNPNGDVMAFLVITGVPPRPWKTYYNTTGSNFGPAAPLSNYPNYTATTPGLQFADINGDGYVDVVLGKSNAYTIWMNDKANGFLSSKTVTNFPNVEFKEPLVSFIDMNSDGLVDIVYFENNGRISIYFNNGTNDFNSPILAGQFQGGTYHSTKFMDMNGDNLTDVMLDDPNNYRVLLNKGEAGFKSPLSMGNSPTVDLYNENSILVDLNADGRMDLLSGPNNGYQAWLNKRDARCAKIATLVDVDNSIGGHLELRYQHLPIKGVVGSGYKIAVSPFVFNAVQSVSRRDNLDGTLYVTTYNYQGGLWNNVDREFRGFKTVKIIDADGNYSTTDFAQDDIFKGRPLNQATYDKTGNLFNKSTNIWDYQVLNPRVNFIFLKQTDSFVYDGNATGRRTQAQFFYEESPQYGNLTKSINFGEVNLTTGADIGTDKTTTEATYHNNTTTWLLGLPKVSTVKNSSGVIFSQATFYYDSNTDYNALPTKGFLTKKVDWAGSAPGTVHPFTKYSYDAIGNVLSLEDSKGSKTTTVYDATYRLFPLQTTNALGHKVVNEYYGINGVALNSSDGTAGLWGQVKSTTDPNQQKGLQIYDTFGRLSKIVSPFDTIALPTKSYEYLYSSSQLKIVSHQRIKSGQAETIDTVQFYDGLGRLVQSKSKSETAGKFIVNGQTEYNSRGLPVKKYVSYLTSTPLTDLGPADTTQPYTLIAYDAMGRVLRTTAPDGSYSNVVYDDWTTTSYDENGHMLKSYADAFGRLIKKEEYFGQDGRHALYPATTYTLYATTLYTYDPKGNLIKTQDAKGNITTIVYDTLGRKIQMTDPDMGTWKYGYDVEGNLIWQQDAKGQKINFTYDQVNRLKSKADLGVLTVNYTYDDVNAQNTKGRLTNAAYGGGNTSFKYDELGRELESIKALGSTNYSVFRNYDALDRLVNLQYPDGTKLSYQYNDMGLVESVSEASVVTTPTPPPPAPAPTAMTAPFTQIKFNENTASQTITDSGTGAKHGTAHFYPVQLTTSGKVNRTFNLNTPGNLDQYIEMKSFAQAVKNDSQGSFAFWIKRLPNRVGFVFSSGPTINSGSAFQIFVDNYGTLFVNLFGLADGNYATMFRYSFADASTADVWQHFVVSQDGTGVKVYRNGTLLTNARPNPYYTNIPNTWFKDVTALGDDQLATAYIGVNAQWVTPYNTFAGQIDDFRYYKKGLSVQEIAALYNNGNGTEELTPLLSPASEPPVSAPSVMTAPYAQFKLNDNANSFAVVDSGTGTHSGNATFMTTSLSMAGKVNKTFNLNETYDLNQYIDVSSFAQSVKNDGQGSFAFWIKRLPSTAGMVYSSGSTTTLGSAFQIYVGYDGSLMVNLSALSNGRSLGLLRHTYDNVVPPDVWQHFVIYQDGTGVKVYLNGTSIEGYTTPFYTTNPTAWFKDVTVFGSDQISTGMIGASVRLSGATNFFGGQIDDFRYYQKVLTTDEIKALYNNGAGTEELTPNLSGGAVPPTPITFVKNVDYNALGQMTKVEFGNGVVTTYMYSPTMLRLTNIKTVNVGGTILQDFTYVYDGTGNITSITDKVNTATQTFKYDALNRLTQAVGASYGTKNYTYDQIGNIIAKDGLTYTYSKVGAGPHAVTSLSDGTTITYDANGNMASKSKAGEVMQYSYDSENRLYQVRKNTTLIAEYLYDGDGGRVQKTSYLTTVNQTAGGLSYGALFGTSQISSTPVISKYIGEVYEETDNVGTNFIFLGSQRIAALDVASRTPLYYHGDHLGSTNVMSDGSGNVAELLEYDPYGKIQRHDALNGNNRLAKQQFTGKKLDDETGLIYFGARYYDPSLGRFITPDTIVQNPSDPQTLNRYSYCSNNPINKIDLDGHKWSWKKFWNSFVGAFVGAVIGILTYGAGFSLMAAGFWGGFVGGGVSGGLEGGWKGALMGAAIGGALGAVGGWALQNGKYLVLGGMFGAGVGNAAVNNSWDSFSGGISGGIAGSIAGTAYQSAGAPGSPRNKLANNLNQEKIRQRALNIKQADQKFGRVGTRSIGGSKLEHMFSEFYNGDITEMGPGFDGKIKVFQYNRYDRSSILAASSEGNTPLETMRGILNATYSERTSVSASGFNNMVQSYQSVWSNQNYVGGSFNSNYAVNVWIYGAGGKIDGPIIATFRPSFAGSSYYEVGTK